MINLQQKVKKQLQRDVDWQQEAQNIHKDMKNDYKLSCRYVGEVGGLLDVSAKGRIVS